MLQEADMGTTQMAMSDGTRFQGDEKVFAQFYMKAVQDHAKSKAEGRAIFRDKPYIKIVVPGDKSNIVNRPARDIDKQRFPRQWAAFENMKEQPLEGTPIEEWPLVTRSQAEELKFIGVFTVEMLAEMPDSASFMGSAVLKQKAQEWLDATKGTADIQALHDRISELEAQVESAEESEEYVEDESVQDD